MDISAGNGFLGLRHEKVSISMGPILNGYFAVGIL